MTPLHSSFGVAFRALARARLRSALTVLGILVGIAAVVVVVALGQGATGTIGERIKTLGANVVYIFDQPVQRSGVRPALGASIGLTEGDAEALRREAGALSDVTVFASTVTQAVTPFANGRTTVMGTDLSYFPVRGFDLLQGRVWTSAEEHEKAKVVLIGPTTSEKLFGSADPIGQTVRIGKHPYRVIGTLVAKGTSPFGQDQDDRLMMPIGTFRAHFQPWLGRRVHMIMASSRSDEATSLAVKEIEEILRERHHVQEGHDADFVIHTQEQVREMQNRIVGVLSVLLLAVAAVSLFVGGVGVMNIMLVTVAERRREIGIRMALGAEPRDIQLQFLTEAVVLTSMGGLAGLLVAAALVEAGQRALGWSMRLGVLAPAVAIATSFMVGIAFGFVPARRAAHVEPMEALRHE